MWHWHLNMSDCAGQVQMAEAVIKQQKYTVTVFAMLAVAETCCRHRHGRFQRLGASTFQLGWSTLKAPGTASENSKKSAGDCTTNILQH